MEPEASLHEGAVESSSFGTTLELGVETRAGSAFSSTNELTGKIGEMPGQSYESSMEMITEIGQETYDLRPGIEFSTDLRMELSADVLASLGGSSNVVEKSHEDNLLEITSMREDVHFIPEIPLSPPPDPVDTSDRGNFTSDGTSPQTEADSCVCARVGSRSSEARYDFSVPASTGSDSELHRKVDPAMGESTNEYPNPHVFENSATVPVEPPVDMVVYAASLSFPMSSTDTGTPEARGSSHCDASLSSGANHESSSGDVLHPVSVAVDSVIADNVATSLSVLDATTDGDGYNTTLEIDRITMSLTTSTSSDLAGATPDNKELPLSVLEKSPVTYVTGEVCPQQEVLAAGFFKSPLGAMLSHAAGGGESSELRSSSLLLEASEAADNQAPVASENLSALQDVPAYDLKDGGLFPPGSTHSQIERSALAEPQLTCLPGEPSEQVSGPAEHGMPSSTCEPSSVVLVEDLHVEPASVFVEDPLGNQAQPSSTIQEVITVAAPLSARDQTPSLSPTLEEPGTNGQAFLSHAPGQGLSLPSSIDVSQLNQRPALTGSSPFLPGFSVPSENVPQSLSAALSEFEPAGVQYTRFPSDWITTKSDVAGRPESIFLPTKRLQSESEAALPSAEPGHFWDVPSSSGRSLPSLPTLSAYFDGSRSPFRGRKTARRKKSSDSIVDGKGKFFTEMDKNEEVVELESMVEAQKKSMQWQIDELQRIMRLQCQLTGRNPLSEEMVYEVLGEKGAENKSSEQLSAEALRHMREVFAIKDTITKKEAREIGSVTGASVSQVQDFFTAQKVLVKKLVQQAFDETAGVGVRNATDQSSISGLISTIGVERDLGFHKLTSVESLERYLELIRVERTFFGQIQLLQIILRTDVAATILRKFLEKGGLKILHQWLVEAAAEEQTSVLRQLLKALVHLPISSSVPHQMPALIQNVNKLRFYQNLDVSAEARTLLAKWSKMLKQKSAAVKPSGSVGNKSTSGLEKNSASTPSGLKRNREILPMTHGGPGPRKKKAKEEESSQPESKVSAVSTPGSPIVNASTPALSVTTPPPQPSAPTPQPAKQRWSTTLQPSESAVAAVSVSRKRVASKSLGDRILAEKRQNAKERRKVQLVEDTPAGKNLPSAVASKSTVPKNSRPLSTDDIYKAKKLQRLLQEPLTKSRKRFAGAQETVQAPEIAPQAATKKDLPATQQQDVSRSLPGSTSPLDSPLEHSSWTKQTPPSASTTERNEVSRWASFASRSQQESYQPSVTPTASPDRGPRIITPTSSPDRGPRVITPTSSPDRPQLIITPTSSPDRPEGVVKSTITQGVPEIVITTLSPEHKFQSVITATSDSTQDLTQRAVVLDTSTQNSYTMSPLTSGLTADGSQVISPYSSNIGLIESVKRSEPPEQSTDVTGAGLSSLYEEHGGVSAPCAQVESVKPAEHMPRDNLLPAADLANTQSAFVEPIQHFSPVSKQNFSQMEPQCQVGRVQMYSIPSPTPPEENEITGAEQICEPSSSRLSCKETPVVDYYAALRANMIRWRIPPVYHLDPQWNVAAGEDSKEKEGQSARVKREEESYYPDASSIPSDPKDPWEEEPNYDDSLTFEIYLDNSQRKPAPGIQVQTDHLSAPGNNLMPPGIPANSFMIGAPNSIFSGYTAPDPSGDLSRKAPNVNGLDVLLQQLSASGGVAHDPALLSLLLQNPDLVNQLTSGQGYAQSGITNRNVVAPPLDSLKQPGNIGSVGAVLRNQTGDIAVDIFGASNIPVSVVHPPQSARAAPSVTQVQPETMRVEDPALKHPLTGMGHQQNPGFVPQAGVDHRYPAPPQMQPALGSTSGWEQGRMAPPLPPLPPPPPLPPMPSGGNQVLQPSVQPPANKVTNWPEPQAWSSVGAVVGRPPLSTAQIHSGQEPLHMRPQTIMTPNVRPPNFGGVVGMPQVEVNPVVSQQEMHNTSQRQWTNGSHLVIAPSVNDNAMIQAGQDSGVGRNNRWPRPPGPPGPPPPDSQMRPVGREYSDFQGSRRASVAENLGVWVPNDRGRPGPPPFQGGYRPPPPPPPPPYPAPQQWHQTPERNVRPGPASAVPPFQLGRDLRPQQPQPPQSWHPNMGPPRPIWRGPQ